MKVTNSNHLEFLKRYIITRTDVYAIQDKYGRYRKISKQLTNAALTRHLKKIITIGCYNTIDNHVKYALLDVDGHEGKDVVPDEIVRKRASKLITTLKELDIPYTLAESSHGSYHIAVLFDPPAPTEKAYGFIRWVARCAELPNTESFPKQKTVGADGYGNLVRIPFGSHKKKQVPYRYINDKFEYVDEFEVIPIDITGFATNDSYQPPTLIEDGNGEPMPPMRTTAAKSGVPPCLQACLENNVELVGGGGHYARISIVCAYRDIGLKFPALCHLFSNQADYDQVETAKQVKSVLKKDGGYSYSCRTLREKCQRFVLQYCDECPRGRRFK